MYNSRPCATYCCTTFFICPTKALDMPAFLENMKVRQRLWLLAAVALLGMIAMSSWSLFILKKNLLEERQVKTRHVVETAHGVLSYYHTLSTQGKLSDAEARSAAVAAVKALRYEGKEYFWINDMHPTMVMHPMKPELDGKDLSGFADPQGKKLFVAFVDEVRAKGAGLVFYLWPKPGASEPVPKVSYVKGFAPWGWVIGSGVYIDDVEALFFSEALKSLTAVLFGVGVLLAASWLVARSIVGQLGGELNYTSAVVHRIADGDLTTSVNLAPDDRDSLLFAVHTMQDKLREMISRIVATSENVASSSTQLAGLCQNVASASERQTEATASTAAAVEEMSTSIDLVSENAVASRQVVQQTVDFSARGKELVGNAAAEITHIATSVTEASRKLHDLRQVSEQINNIVNVIREIADQTNLLALNAAIEAARAGETGRGFAVVADEVRKLAERTGQATSEIRGMIDTIQSETLATVAVMESGSSQVENGVRLINEVVAPLQELHRGAVQALDQLTELVHSTQEQSATSGQIAKNVETIANMSETNHSAVRESSDAANHLHELAGQLKQSMRRFNV